MVTHRYWQRALGANPAAIGQSIMVNGTAREVIGVLPADFKFLRSNPVGDCAVQVRSHDHPRRGL